MSRYKYSDLADVCIVETRAETMSAVHLTLVSLAPLKGSKT